MPYRNPMAKTYDTGQFELVMDKAIALADWNGFDARAAESKRARQAARPRHGDVPRMDRRRRVHRARDGDRDAARRQGEIEMFSATQGMGQGLLTTYAQLAVDVFGVPIERIRIVQGDTDRGTGFGSAGSRSLFVGGSAVHVAAKETVDEARKLAAADLETAVDDIEYRDGEFRIGGTDRRIGLFELARKQPERRIVVDSHKLGRRRDLAERLPRRARSRSIRTPARSRSTATGRSTTSGASSIR